jgi:N-acetylglucosaminyl-diphospho-decaprenol L-rhamnosyltransferase
MPKAGDRHIDIVIVSCTGSREVLRACLQSIVRHPLRRGVMTVHLVDNASRDGTVEEVRERFPWVEVTELDWNSGFCIANNVALARGKAPYALLLNPDTELSEGALDHCMNVIERMPDVGMLGCRLVQPDGTFDHAAKRSFPTPLAALAHFSGVGRHASNGRLAQYRATDVDQHGHGDVDAVNGAFMLVRREAMEQVGLLDEAYWLYMEDLDWCYRFHQAGWRVWYDGSVSILHVKGGASKIKHHRPLQANVAFHRGMGRFYRKFYAGEQPLLDALVYAGVGGKLLVSATRSAAARRSIR